MFEGCDDKNNNKRGKVIIIELFDVLKYFSKYIVTPKPLIDTPFEWLNRLSALFQRVLSPNEFHFTDPLTIIIVLSPFLL